MSDPLKIVQEAVENALRSFHKEKTVQLPRGITYHEKKIVLDSVKVVMEDLYHILDQCQEIGGFCEFYPSEALKLFKTMRFILEMELNEKGPDNGDNRATGCTPT